MNKIVILTDSNAGISIEEGKNLGIEIVPMPFVINGEEYFEGISLSQEEFYHLLKNKADISTSQPSQYALMEIWDNLLTTYEEIIYLPMSSGLSASCASATTLSKEEKYLNKVHVIDNQRISVTLKSSCLEAKYLIEQGKTSQEIISYLLDSKMNSSIYIMVDTLEYLKKGGRITPGAAALGMLLNIKPVLQIHGGKLDSYCKVLSTKVGRIKLINAIKNDIENNFKDLYQSKQLIIAIAHTNSEPLALEFKTQVENAIPGVEVKFVNPLSLSVSCHIGPGALAIACMPNINGCIK